MFRNRFSTDTFRPRKLAARRVMSRRRPTLSVERLEERAVPTTYFWNGSQNSNYTQPLNWTDVNNSANHNVPTATDGVIIQGAPNDPTMNQNETLVSLQVMGGNLTIKTATLTVTGSYSQSAGQVSFFASSDKLQIAGNITRDGGLFSTSAGIVELNGMAGQTVMDTSFHQYPNLLISNTSSAGVTLPGGSNVSATSVTLNANATLTLLQGVTASFLFDTGTFTDNGNVVMTQLTPNGNTNTALIQLVGGVAVTVSATTTFDLTVASPSTNAVYTFITYGSETGTLAAGATTIHGNGPFAAAASLSGSALTVTLTSPGTIDTWTGGTDSNFANAANWTASIGTHVAPTSSDLVIIKGAPHDPILSGNTTVGGLQISGGFLTINAILTDTGTYYQDQGFVAFGSNANELQIAGNVTRPGGVFLGALGTVRFNGTNQTVFDTSGHTFGANIIVNSTATTVTIQSGSVLSVTSNFTNNGTVNLSMATSTSNTPLVIGNNLIEGTGSVFNLNLGNTATGLTYIFITFGGTESGSATFNKNAGTVNHNMHNITVTT
jgi:hypothetical protein